MAKEGHGAYEDDENIYPGLIAEELHELYPEYVTYDDRERTTPKSVMYDRVVVLLVHELQKSNEKIRALEEKITKILS